MKYYGTLVGGFCVLRTGVGAAVGSAWVGTGVGRGGLVGTGVGGGGSVGIEVGGRGGLVGGGGGGNVTTGRGGLVFWIGWDGLLNGT